MFTVIATIGAAFIALLIINVLIHASANGNILTYVGISLLLFLIAPTFVFVAVTFIGFAVFGSHLTKKSQEQVTTKAQDDFPDTIIQPHESTAK